MNNELQYQFKEIFLRDDKIKPYLLRFRKKHNIDDDLIDVYINYHLNESLLQFAADDLLLNL